MMTPLRASASVLLLLAAPVLIWADEPQITIRTPEVNKGNKELAVQARAEFHCRVEVKFSEPVTWPGLLVVHIAEKRLAAGSYELKPKRINDRVYEFEGMVRAPAADKYVMTAVRYDINAKESPAHKSKLLDGKPNPAEMIIDVRPPR